MKHSSFVSYWYILICVEKLISDLVSRLSVPKIIESNVLAILLPMLIMSNEVKSHYGWKQIQPIMLWSLVEVRFLKHLSCLAWTLGQAVAWIIRRYRPVLNTISWQCEAPVFSFDLPLYLYFAVFLIIQAWWGLHSECNVISQLLSHGMSHWGQWIDTSFTGMLLFSIFFFLLNQPLFKIESEEIWG